MEETQARIWYIVLAFVIISAAAGTFAFLWYSSQQTDLTAQSAATNNVSTPRPAPTRTPQASPSPTTDPTITELKTLSTSDEIQDIEKDIETTNLDNLDKELQQIQTSL